MLFQRVLSGFIIAATILAVTLNEFVLDIFLAIIIILALYEVYKPFGLMKKLPLAVLGFSLALCFAFGDLKYSNFTTPLICGYVMLMFILAICYHKTIKFPDIALLLFTTIYIALFLAHIRLLKDENFGSYLIYSVFIGAWATDTGAYFSGMHFGKNKLIPEISPNKTVEGAVGGMVFTIISFVAYGFVLEFFLNLNFPISYTINFINIALLGLVSSIAAQVGDIAASMIKRELGIKDYGNILPGHGGILDRFDSVIFVAPVVYYFVLVIPIIITR